MSGLWDVSKYEIGWSLKERNMRRIVNSEEMRECDRNTIEYFGIPSLVLMERAALSVADSIPKEFMHERILVVCGNGNNGADGLAVARLLQQRGCEVTVAQMPDTGKRSKENQVQRNILEQYGFCILDAVPEDSQYACVIDALFGVGLSRAPKKEFAEWIGQMNRLLGYKVAVDMPSGVSSDTGEAYPASFQADLTVTFAYQKLGQLLYPGREKCGIVKVADIGITDDSWLDRKPFCYAPEKAELYHLPHRPPRSNKGTFGKLLVIAGSKNMAGAALFCAQAAYGTGCGLVKIHTPEENRMILQSALPEAILSVYEEKRPKTELLDTAIQWADVIAIGPGLGTGKQARRMVEQTLEYADVPLVADADALNILAQRPELLARTKAPLIITPHLGEMARLCGKQISDIQNTMLQTAVSFAKSNHLVCVLKDAVTVTTDGTDVYLNTSGCSAMAKGGSGDVLTGIIAALLAQGMTPKDAAYMGVYIHGLAGEAAAAQVGIYSVLARDIVAAIGRALQIRQ